MESMDCFVAELPEGAKVLGFNYQPADSLFGTHRPVHSITVTANGSQRKVVYWGDDNNEPANRELLVQENNNVPALLKKRRNMITGAGLMLYRERFEWDDAAGAFKRIVDEVEMPEKMKMDLATMKEKYGFDLTCFLRCAAGELVKQGQFFIEFIEKGAGDVVDMRLHECLYVRAEKSEKKPGAPKIQNWLLCGDWLNTRKSEVVAVANHNPLDRKQTKYIRRFGDEMFGGPYYYMAAYWGSKLWIKLANVVPEFHLRNLQNGYLIRYHIRYPKGYFTRIPDGKTFHQLTAEEKKKVMEDSEAAKKTFMNTLNELLVGVKNAGRTLYTSYDIKDLVQGKFPGVEIEAIEVDLKDSALLDLFEKSNTVASMSQGIHPSISGIQTQGKLSSGSDIRNALALYLATDVQEERRILFSALEHVAEKNGWFEGELMGTKIGARDIVIVTSDKDAKGMETKDVNESEPA